MLRSSYSGPAWRRLRRQSEPDIIVMTTVFPANKARGARLTGLATTTIIRAIKVGSASRYDKKYLRTVNAVREELDDVRAGRVASREFVGGFVDFLLGRGAR
jgi:hypothetical protein